MCRERLLIGIVVACMLAACHRDGAYPPATGAAPAAAVVNNGDINGDGLVDHRDVLLAQQIVLGITLAAPDQVARGDVHANGSLDVSDYLLIQQRVLGP
jgi:Dockerin type I domain